MIATNKERVARETRDCKTCGIEMRVSQAATRKYCSKTCQGIGSRHDLVEKIPVRCSLESCTNFIKMSVLAAKKLSLLNGKHFCSKDCLHQWRIQRFSGKGNPMFGVKRKPTATVWKKGHVSWNMGSKALRKHPCQICGRITLNDKFCSIKCTAKYNRIRLTGKVSKIKGSERILREARPCSICGKITIVRQTSTRKYCSRECQNIGSGWANRGRPAWNRGLPNVNTTYYAKVKAGYREDLGHFVRSSWEADFARLWKYLDAPYEYEKHRFDLGELGTYCPDFYLPEREHFYEVKGWMDYEVQEKLLKTLYEKYRIEIYFISPARFLAMLFMIKEKLPALFVALENQHLVKHTNQERINAALIKEDNNLEFYLKQLEHGSA